MFKILELSGFLSAWGDLLRFSVPGRTEEIAGLLFTGGGSVSIVDRAFLTPYFMKILYIAYPLLTFCPIPPSPLPPISTHTDIYIYIYIYTNTHKYIYTQRHTAHPGANKLTHSHKFVNTTCYVLTAAFCIERIIYWYQHPQCLSFSKITYL